jgi:hypothetical protein
LDWTLKTPRQNCSALLRGEWKPGVPSDCNNHVPLPDNRPTHLPGSDQVTGRSAQAIDACSAE